MSPRMPAVPKETLWKLFKILLHQNYDNWIYSTRLYLITFNCFYAKKAIPGLFFLYFRLFNTVDRKQMFRRNFADDWIRTADLRYRKQPLYQLSHNHCPLS